MQVKEYLTAFALLFIIGFTAGCGEDGITNNPFDDPSLKPSPEDTLQNHLLLEPTSIEGLHQAVFKPVCANSGCHDGTFEPHFSTIESTYNTLVNHPATKTDLSATPITQRVVPGNADMSMLVFRLTGDLSNSSGRMPLEVDPDSDWDEKREEYISNIRTWINNGAPNVLD